MSVWTRDRFLSRVRVDPATGCWVWQGAINSHGYGNIRSINAHRVAYEVFVGPVAKDLVVDHLCHNTDADCAGGSDCLHRRCVNPAHLEAITTRENLLRGKSLTAAHARKSHCVNGHPFDELNTRRYGDEGRHRRCRACDRATSARYRERIAKRKLVDDEVRQWLEAAA